MTGEHEGRGRGRPPFGGRRGHRGGRFDGGEPTGSFFGRGPRAARGDIRAAILALLAEEPMHGYQVIKELGARSGGVWKPSPGSVYPTLQHLEEEGVVAGRDQDGKRVFELTDAGRAEVAARAAGRPAPWDEVGAEVDSELVDLRDLARQVAVAVRQVAHAGTAAQVDAASRVLTDARRAMYRILADEPTGPDGAADQ
jgi:DNA-binding PadR family transcriptional regulator